MSIEQKKISQWINQTTLDRALDDMLRFWLLFAALILILSLSRMVETGWMDVFYLHIYSYIALAFAYFVRRWLNYKTKIMLLLVLCTLVAAFGVINYGVASGTIFLLPFAALLLALFYPLKVFILYTSMMLAFLLVIAFLISNSVIQPKLAEGETVRSIFHWIAYIGTLGFLFGAGVKALRVYQYILFDLVEKLEQKQKESEYHANHDPLTCLPIRRLLLDRIRMLISHARRYRKKVAVFFIDLDGFKQANDQFGHQVGDQCLIEVGCRLESCFRSTDTVSRLGGDEFVVVIGELDQVGQVIQLVEKVVASIEQSMQIGDHIVQLGASVGIALFPDHDEVVADLINKADSAMYQAKRRRDKPYVLWSDSLVEQHANKP